jgi:DNA-directed RNA polymerase omega subunit
MENQNPDQDHTPSFQLVVVAAARAKQLLHGSKPRIAADPSRRKHTSIAVEEVRRQLVSYSSLNGKGFHLTANIVSAASLMD